MENKDLAIALFMEFGDAAEKFCFALRKIKRKLGTEMVKNALELYMPVVEIAIEEVKVED